MTTTTTETKTTARADARSSETPENIELVVFFVATCTSTQYRPSRKEPEIRCEAITNIPGILFLAKQEGESFLIISYIDGERLRRLVLSYFYEDFYW